MTSQTANEEEQKQVADPEAGFSLVELMVVIFIMGLLGTLIFVYTGGATDKARLVKVSADIRLIEEAIESYRNTTGRYPDQTQGIDAVRARPAGSRTGNTQQGILTIRRIENDPWGNPYEYAIPAQRSGWEFDVFSSGPDGEPGNEDDIGNWDPS